MWPAKRKQPRPRSPACAGKAVRLPFPQQKPPLGAVFLWAADGSRLMPPAAKVPSAVGTERTNKGTRQALLVPASPAHGSLSPHQLTACRSAAEKQKNNGGPVARMPPLSCHQRAEGLRLSILEHFPVCNASRSKPSSLSIHGKRGFSAWFRPGGAVTPPRVFPFFKGKTL